MYLKNYLIIGWLCLLAGISGTFAQGFGSRKEVADWYFHPGELRLDAWKLADCQEWARVKIPHDWSVESPPDSALASCTGYLPGGVGWYATTITVPADDQKRYLYFEGVYRNSEVYINGHWLGYRPNGYASFLYDITPYVKKGVENVIMVKVDHSAYVDSRWYTGSGIYRKVWLISSGSVHLDLWGVFATSEISDTGTATVMVETTISNETRTNATVYIRQELQDRDGNTVVTDRQQAEISAGVNAPITQQLLLSDPQLWSLDTPYLYRLQTIVEDSQGRVLDRTETKIGIRELTFDPDKGFALNGEWMKVKGVCLHHDAGVLGAAVPGVVWRDRLLALREIGVNGIRMSHNPQATDLYEWCDELGFLVMDEGFDEWEYPKKKWIQGWNVGEPGFEGYASFFREWGKRDLEAMVKRDRNHPSVIMWSIGNEVDFPNDPYSHPILDSAGIDQIHAAGYRPEQPDARRLGDIAHELAAVVRANDPSRPVTAALAGAVMSNETDYPGALDVVGYNYTESRYETDHQKYPGRILYGSETRHNIEAWRAVQENEFIFGQFLWTGIDYLGEAGAWPSRGSSAGLLDFAGHIKPRGYFRKALWTTEPMVYVGTYPVPQGRFQLSIDAEHTWDYTTGQQIRVVAYTNCDAAELLLNGRAIGARKPYDSQIGIISWDVAYAPGKLEVVAYGPGKTRIVDVIKTSGVSKQIHAEIKPDLASENDEVYLIEVEVRDKKGELVAVGDPLITCHIDGPATLLGLENAAYEATEIRRDGSARCLHGKLLAYLRREKEEPIKVTFESPGLSSASLIIPQHK